MKTFYSFIILISVLILISCGKEKANALISDYEKLILKASNVYSECDEATWRKLNDEFQILNNKYAKIQTEISNKDKEKLDTLKGRFYSIKVKYDAIRLKQKLKEGYDTIKGFVEEFINDP